MVEETKEIAVVNLDALPSYLVEATGDTGTEDLGQFIKPPRLKIVQKTADDALLNLFSVGDFIVSPANVKAAGMGEVFQFAPLFFWPEWCRWNPYELKATLPMIAERTTDPNDPLVALCRNEKTREFEWHEQVNGKTVFGRNVEHLNFAVEIMSGPAKGLVAVLSFFRAQHQDGTNFSQLIGMRSSDFIYSMQFEAKTYFKQFGGNSWYGLQVSNPTTCAAWATEEDFLRRKELFENLKKAHSMGQMVVDHDETTTAPKDVVEGEVVSETAKF